MNGEILFNRVAVVKFGVKDPASKTASTQTASGKDVSLLRCKFKIEKTLEPHPNKAQIRIYNLNPDSRGLTDKKGIYAVLEAGYEGSSQVIFKGDITTATTELEGADYITTLEVGDGEKAHQTARLDASFAPGTQIKDIFKSVISSFGLGDADVSAVGSATTLNGMSLSGLARSHMTQLANQFGLNWSIQDDKIQLVGDGDHTYDNAVLLSPSTGLIGIPKKKTGTADFVSLLQPKIKPGRLIRLESKFISGDFIAQKVTHTGDTHGKEWFTTIEAIPTNGTTLNNAGKKKGKIAI